MAVLVKQALTGAETAISAQPGFSGGLFLQFPVCPVPAGERHNFSLTPSQYTARPPEMSNTAP
ncbi:hypothetical protein OFO11_31775, partial [Escherichia coli]|nr:hypothetical protein [Escherichia coli]